MSKIASTAYKKGHKPWHKGKKLSSAHRKILSEAQKKAWKEGKYSNKRNKKVSESLKGLSKPPRSREHAERISIALKGRKASLETRKKMKEAQLGERHWRWSGKSSENKLMRQSLEYKLWRTAVYMRDDYTCQSCGKKGERLNAHHIKSFALYPELRFAIDNGETLCIDCHKETDTYMNSYGRNQYV